MNTAVAAPVGDLTHAGPADPLAFLNAEQRAAAGHGLGADVEDTRPLLVIAGAGSGKTSTLDALPLETLSATHAHAPTLQRLGCRTLGAVRVLPRGGVSRRFGAALLEALDRAYGLRPDAFEWIALPEQFTARLEFMGRIEVAEGLLFGARRLLTQLGAWLLARQRGVVALTLHWEHDLVRRGDACNGSLSIRTAEATRDLQHLTRLVGEHLARVTLPAPVVAIRLDPPHR